MGEEVPKHQTPDGDWRDDDECVHTLRRNLLREYIYRVRGLKLLASLRPHYECLWIWRYRQSAYKQEVTNRLCYSTVGW
jgi:hypothetical protein